MACSLAMQAGLRIARFEKAQSSDVVAELGFRAAVTS